MRPLNPSVLLDVWEAGLNRSPLDRGIYLLWAAGVAAPEDVALTDRDRTLLSLRNMTFGPDLSLVTECDACTSKLELDLSIHDLVNALPGSDALQVNGATLRPTTSRDLAAILQTAPDQMARALLARVADKPPADSAKAEEAVEAREREAELTFSLQCVECSRKWTETLDVVDLLWQEIATAAQRLMLEIAEIARAFGWTERETLALSPGRREVYLAHARVM
jgi:hypothetical protein